MLEKEEELDISKDISYDYQCWYNDYMKNESQFLPPSLNHSSKSASYLLVNLGQLTPSMVTSSI